jgi:galactokinase/mevalonate kinase-like predicted kinase
MSRIIFIHSEPTGRKITFPMAIGDHANETLLTQLREIDENVKGPMDISEEARVILDRMYKEYGGVDDPRFKHYGTRRFTHLLKLCIILAASDIRLEITAEDALNANTLLYYTELRMPKALGEYGKSKYSDVSHDILESLSSAVKPLTMNEIFKLVSKDLTKITELADILKNLLAAEKIQIVNVRGKQGYMTRVNETKRWDPSLLNESFLTEEELF